MFNQIPTHYKELKLYMAPSEYVNGGGKNQKLGSDTHKITKAAASLKTKHNFTTLNYKLRTSSLVDQQGPV